MRPRQPSGSESREGHARRVKVETAKPAREGSPGGGGGLWRGVETPGPRGLRRFELDEAVLEAVRRDGRRLGRHDGGADSFKGGRARQQRGSKHAPPRVPWLLRRRKETANGDGVP